MSALAARLVRPPYERAGEYRRPSMRMQPLTKAQREAILASCTLPPHRWTETALQRMPEPPAPIVRLSREQWNAKPGQLCEQRRPASESALPTVLDPVPAEDNPAPSVPRVASTIQETPLSDLARATLEHFRKRYCL